MKFLSALKKRLGNEAPAVKTPAPRAERVNVGSGHSSSGQAASEASGRPPATAKTRGEPQSYGSDTFSNETCQAILALPQLRETPPAERHDVFRKKLQACSLICNFNGSPNLMALEVKRNVLLELVDWVNTTRGSFTESLMGDVVHMVSANIFRALPAKEVVVSSEEEEGQAEKAWPHLQLIYEILLRFVVSDDVDAKVAKRFIDQRFICQLLLLFDSTDARERDYLKTILHRIYGKFMALRPCIRRTIRNIFLQVIHENEECNGIGEILEILCSIINGFAVPLKTEHKDFLFHALIPLHKASTLGNFHQQLTYCMAQYVGKDRTLVVSVVSSLLRFWPTCNAVKEVLFLGELEEALESAQQEEFCILQEPLFRRMALCITNAHFQVAERALFFWNNDHIVKLININREALFPILVEALQIPRGHWKSAVSGLALSVTNLLEETDPMLFEECIRRLGHDDEAKAQARARQEAKWAFLEELHAAKSLEHGI